MNNSVLVKKTDKCSIYWHIPKGWEQVTKGKLKPEHYRLWNSGGNNFRWDSGDWCAGDDVSDMTLVITRTKENKDGKPPR